jgi:hypothetical protein
MQRKWRKFLLSIRGSLSSRHLLLQFLVQTIKEIKARKVPNSSSPLLPSARVWQSRLRKHAVGLWLIIHMMTWVQVNFCLGFLACFLVVMVVAFMVTILANAPVPMLLLSSVLLQHTRLVVLPSRERLLTTRPRCGVAPCAMRVGDLPAAGRAHPGRDGRDSECWGLERLWRTQLHPHQVLHVKCAY